MNLKYFYKKLKITQERKQEKGVLNKSINRDKKSRQKWEKYVKNKKQLMRKNIRKN